MASEKVTIADEVGLHARPAAKFVQAAGRFDSDIQVRKGDRSADAKSMIEVLTLEAAKGDEIVLEATGADADDALKALVGLLQGGASAGSAGGARPDLSKLSRPRLGDTA